MSKLAFWVFSALLLCSGVTQLRAESPAMAAFDEVMAIDRENGAAHGIPIIDKLSAQFSDDVIMPAPGGLFSHGKDAVVAAMSASPANKGTTVSWTPLSGGISADGSHAFTYGYMTTIDEGGIHRFAKYMSYWVKGTSGWRVAAYKRAPRPPEGVTTKLADPVLPLRLTRDQRDNGQDGKILRAVEEAFAAEAQVIGIGPAFRKYGSPLAVNFGQGTEFVIGNDAIAVGVGGPEQAASSPVTWGPDEGVMVAPSGDLGITFGRIRPKEIAAGQPNAMSFFTIWQRAGPEAPWRYVAE